ncbi:MAG: riboflavin synthase [Gammaproteobacteria bacterium]|nr:MAG: riboflavin synthase [Gammaproteobacteria bacterium]
MFTGIVRAVGEIIERQATGGDLRLLIGCGGLDLATVAPGDSIAVNGVCLTATQLDGRSFAADVSAETLALTTLGDLQAGQRVNLEPALTLATPLGGHLVSGHVDGVGRLLGQAADARSTRMEFEIPEQLSRYVVRKGSICIDGVSLTVNAAGHGRFSVNIVPHTLEHTIMRDYCAGTPVNIEVDLVARYLEGLIPPHD